MNHYFFDTSALVKGYLLEPGSRRVHGVLEGARRLHPTARVLVCDLIQSETFTTFQRKRADREISSVSYQYLARRFLTDYEEIFVIIGTVPAIHHDAASLRRTYPLLRTADSVHLAAAIAARSAFRRTIPEVELHFVSSDERQLEAAEAENFSVWDPQR